MSESVISPSSIPKRPHWRERFGDCFFVAMAAMLLALVVLGFSRTLFFRPFFGLPDLPVYLSVHGIVLSIWYLLFLVQSLLVATHRVAWHRQLGVVGVALAVCVVAVSVVVTFSFIPRGIDAGADEARTSQLVQTFIAAVWALLSFVVLIAGAIVLRRRPEIHKRLMLFASIAIIGPAGTRVPIVLAAMGLSPRLGAPFLVISLAGPVVYDIVVRGRPHIATVLCLGLVLVSIASPFWLVGNESVRAFVLTL